MKWLATIALAVFCLSGNVPRRPDAGVAHGTAVVFRTKGDRAAIAADTGTFDPRDRSRRIDRCKTDILSDPAALIGVGGAVVLGDERWALDILASAVRDHRPIDKSSAHALVEQFQREMEIQMRRYPVVWGDQIDLQGVVILPADRGKGFLILVFQGVQKVRKGELSLAMQNFEFLRTDGAEHHEALEMGVRVINEIDEASSDRGVAAASDLRAQRTLREYVTRAVEYAKMWYPENVFGSIDVATMDSGVPHLYRSTVCSRPKLKME